MRRTEQLGTDALRLLAESWMLSVVLTLADGEERPAELEQRLPRTGHAVLIRRLRRLTDRGLTVKRAQHGVPPHPRTAGVGPETHYVLSDAGRSLLDVAVEAASWERRWCSDAERSDPAGILPIRHLADRHTRQIIVHLAEEPRTAEEIEAAISTLGRSAIRRRLRELVLKGLLAATKARGPRQFELTTAARDLAALALHAGRWEWRWQRPDKAHPTRDLRDLLRVLAPLCHLDPSLVGLCQLHVQGANDADIYLVAHDGGIRTLSRPASEPPVASGRATPQQWCDQVFAGDSQITPAGDRLLLANVLQALRASATGEARQT